MEVPGEQRPPTRGTVSNTIGSINEDDEGFDTDLECEGDNTIITIIPPFTTGLSSLTSKLVWCLTE